jgi:hypothetical protein
VNVTVRVFVAAWLILLVAGCQQPASTRTGAGWYNYSGVLGDEGETTAVAVAIGDGTKGFAIACRTADYCLRRAADVCAPKSPTIVSSQNAGTESDAYGTGRDSSHMLMQIRCAE